MDNKMTAVTIKCPNCGGYLQFDPGSQNYKCEYCLSMFTEQQKGEILEASADRETDRRDGVDIQAVMYHCSSCGAEIVTDETTAATFCYYCHNPVVLSGRLSGEYRPDYVIPFAVDREKATAVFRQWIGRKKYVPKAFFSESQIETITGVYFPYWTYSCTAKGQLEAEGRKVRTWVAGNIRNTETQKYLVERNGVMDVRYVPRNALKKANRRLVEGVFPYDMKQLKRFSLGFLSGFQAENRDMERQEFVQDVEQEVETFALNTLRQEVGSYDSVTVRSQQAEMTDKTWDYVLMPVWTLTYKSPQNGKIYYFACNGQSGKVCGELPVALSRLAGLFAGIFVPVLAVLLIVGWLI